MNQQDLAELTKKLQLETKFLNVCVDDSLKLSQDHAYALGLKRGRADCAELVEALTDLVNGPEVGGDHGAMYRNARAVIAKVTGEAV